MEEGKKGKGVVRQKRVGKKTGGEEKRRKGKKDREMREGEGREGRKRKGSGGERRGGEVRERQVTAHTSWRQRTCVLRHRPCRAVERQNQCHLILGWPCVSPAFTASLLDTCCAQSTVTLSMGVVFDSHGMPTASPEARQRDADLSV